MHVIVNDTDTELPEGATISVLLGRLHLPSTRVAVEVNKVLIRRGQHADHRLANGDRLEVVTLVGGG
jgi:sulfur carrier protein